MRVVLLQLERDASCVVEEGETGAAGLAWRVCVPLPGPALAISPCRAQAPAMVLGSGSGSGRRRSRVAGDKPENTLIPAILRNSDRGTARQARPGAFSVS